MIQTIGHSTRPLDEFIHLLTHYGVKLVIDIRTVPRSKKNPQFNRETLPDELARQQIDYRHMAGLGGLRHARVDSINTGWRNESFRGFADYMQTAEFEYNLEELIKIGKTENLALMCAEAVPWRCHRSLIADALTIRSIPVEHILSITNHYPHKLTPFVKVEGLKIIYLPTEDGQAEFKI